MEQESFSCRITKDRKGFISKYGKQVTILSGRRADECISGIALAGGKAAQLLMAKATDTLSMAMNKAGKAQTINRE